MAEERQLSNELKINNLVIKKRSGDDNTLQIIPAPENDGVWEEIFMNMSIRESIFNNGVSGFLKIREPGIMGDKFNLIGDEIVEIDMESPGIENASKSLKFCVTNVTYSGDEASQQLMGPGARADAHWRIEFGSCETLFLGHIDVSSDVGGGGLFKFIEKTSEEDDTGPLAFLDESGEVFIGPIASEEEDRLVESTSQKIGRKVGDFVDDLFDDDESDDENFPKKGLMNYIAEKYFDPDATPFSLSSNKMTIEPTHNNIVLSKQKPLYPWKKQGQPPTLIQTIYYIAENSVTEDLMGVNYIFYADFDGWHFRSIRDIIQKSETDFIGIALDSPRKYFITDFDFPEDEWKSGHPRIKSFRILKEYDHLKLFNMGAYSSKCKLWGPENSTGYESYKDRPGHKSLETADYNYLDVDWGGKDDGGQIEEYKLLTNEWYDHLESTKKEIMDDGIYGWFGTNYNAPIVSYPATMPKGKRTQTYSWQAQFDQTKLKASLLHKIIKVIPNKKFGSDCENENSEDCGKVSTACLFGSIKPSATTTFRRKEKWEIFENVVCCGSSEDEEEMEKYAFYAVIESAEPIYYTTEEDENEEDE